MMAPTFDERASTLTKSLLEDAQRIPVRLPDERTKSAPWKTIAVFAASVAVIGSAVAGVSIALHGASVAKSAPASPTGHWKSFELKGVVGGLTSVGCLDASYCIAVDHDGKLWISTNPGGGPTAWSLMLDETVAGKVMPLLKKGTTWISCAGDPSRCVASDQGGDVATLTPVLHGPAAHILSIYGGVDGGQVTITGVSCETALCVTIGGFAGHDPGRPLAEQSGYVATYTETADYGGAMSSIELPGASALTTVSCPSLSFCVVTDALGDVLTSTDPSGSASAWKVTRAVVPANNSFSALSCPSVTFCVAVTRHGDVVTSTDPTGGAHAWKTTRLDGSTTLDSVSCATRDFCIVGGVSESVFVSHNPAGGGSAWTQVRVTAQGTKAMVALSCPSTGFCAGVDGGDGVHIYTNPGR
jgi:hypothetical protein